MEIKGEEGEEGEREAYRSLLGGYSRVWMGPINEQVTECG